MDGQRPVLQPSPLRTALSSSQPTRSSSPFGLPIKRLPSHEGLRGTASGSRSSSNEANQRKPSAFVPLLETGTDLTPPKHADLEFLVLSGGSGANAITPAFATLGAKTTFVLPISDNGGSSSEIIRVVGGTTTVPMSSAVLNAEHTGPSIGDIRSRLIRLIPSPTSASDVAIKRLLEHRMSATRTTAELKADWMEIVEGHSNLWKDVLPERREVIRAFLVHFESELLKRANKRFSFRQGSIGNLFLAGAMVFFRSFESAIFLFCSITGINTERLAVLPCIHTNSVATISAELEDGSVLTGQMEISHPASLDANRTETFEGLRGMLLGDDDALGHGLIGRAYEEQHEAHPDDRNTVVRKDDEPSLASRIRRIFYINSYGQEVFPKANPNFMARIKSSSCLVYCCGSLWTSIAPCLALRGVGHAIANSPSLRYKILMLNTKADREVPVGSTAIDVVQSIRRILNHRTRIDHEEGTLSVYQASDYVTHLLYLEGGELRPEVSSLELLGIRAVPIRSTQSPPMFNERNVAEALDAILAGICDLPSQTASAPLALPQPSPLRLVENA